MACGGGLWAGRPRDRRSDLHDNDNRRSKESQRGGSCKGMEDERAPDTARVRRARAPGV